MGSFWDNAVPLMKVRGVKQSDLVKLTGKTNATVSDWVNKGVIPRADDAVKIADLLGVSVRYLCTGKDDIALSAMKRRLLEVCKDLSEPMLNKVIKDTQAAYTHIKTQDLQIVADAIDKVY